MSILTELSDAICICERAFDTDMYKAESVMKIADMQRQCSINDYELGMMKEAAEDSLNLIMEEANEKFIDKVKLAASKAIEAIKKFFKDLIDKVKSIHKSISEKVSKLNTKNPFVARRKVQGPNKNTIKMAEKEYSDFQKDLNKLALRAAAGDDIRIDDVLNCYDKFIRNMDNITSSETLTIRECQSIAYQAANEADKALDKIASESAKAMQDVSKRAEKIDSPDKASVFSQIINTMSRAAQKAGSVIAAFPGKVVSALGKGVDKNAEREEPVEESVSEEESTDEATVTESTVDDLEKIFSLDLDEILGNV